MARMHTEPGSLKLIARWDEGQDVSTDPPRNINWSNGLPATMRDYEDHMDDTRTFVTAENGHLELHMFPNIEAEVVFDPVKQLWIVQGPGVVSYFLENTDPNAGDFDLLSEVWMQSIIYRAVVKR